MDYILEELERQRLAMELLLALPASQQSRAPELEDETARREHLEPAETVESSRRARRTDGQTGAEKTGSKWELYTAESQVRSVNGAAETRRLRRENRVEVPAAPREDLTWNWMTGTALRQSAQELSRTVERDARRYDGGYRSY